MYFQSLFYTVCVYSKYMFACLGAVCEGVLALLSCVVMGNNVLRVINQQFTIAVPWGWRNFSATIWWSECKQRKQLGIRRMSATNAKRKLLIATTIFLSEEALNTYMHARNVSFIGAILKLARRITISCLGKHATLEWQVMMGWMVTWRWSR